MTSNKTEAVVRPSAQSVIDQKISEALVDEANGKHSTLQYNYFADDVPEIRLPDSVLHLKKLHCLTIRNVKIINVEILGRLQSLERLEFGSYHASLPDLTFVGNLKNLNFLELTTSADIELSQICGLSNLEQLRISNVQVNKPINIGSFKSLVGMPKLQHLSFGNIVALDYDAIGHCTELTSVSFSRTNCNSLSFAEGLQKLTYLVAAESPIRDITSLSGLKNLEELGLWKTEVRDISCLPSLLKLRDLNLSDTLVDDVDPIGRCVALKEIDLSGTPITSLYGIARSPQTKALEPKDLTWRGLKKFRSFNFANTRIFDLSALVPERNLEGLDVSGTDLSDLSIFAEGLTVRRLNVSNTKVSSLGPEGCLSEVGALYAENTTIKDLDALRGAKLYALNVDGTQVSDLSSLQNVAGLQTLSISRTQVGDLSILRSAASGLSDERARLRLDFEETPIANKSELLTYLSKMSNKDRCFIETKFYLTGSIPNLATGTSDLKVQSERKRALAEGADPNYILCKLESSSATKLTPREKVSISPQSTQKALAPNLRHVLIGFLIILVPLGLLIALAVFVIWKFYCAAGIS